MKRKQFDRLVKELFAPVLEPEGFSTNQSKHCTFWRKTSTEIWHFILPDLGNHGEGYNVYVFPSSPVIHPLFDEKFPDDLSFPTHPNCYLSDSAGVGHHKQYFSCKTEERMRFGFGRKVENLLRKAAVPHLDSYIDMKSLLPDIHAPFGRILALAHCGQYDEAAEILKQQRERLLRFDRSAPEVQKLLARFEELFPDVMQMS